MAERRLLVALACGRLQGMLDLAARYPAVVFGTMQGKRLEGITYGLVDTGATDLPVYFYETG